MRRNLKTFWPDEAPGFVLPARPLCGACGLYKLCKNPKMPVAGQGRKNILVVGEAPGFHEDKRGEPFVGPSGEKLRVALKLLGIDLKRDCYVTNAAICRPPENKLPEKAVDHCRPNLIDAVTRLSPDVILLLGKSAIRSFITWAWKEDEGKLEKWAGWKIPCQKANAWVIPTWHPAFILRKERQHPLTERFWMEHLALATSCQGKPFGKVPNYRSQIEVLLNTQEASRLLGKMAERGGPVAFDYETTTLKPDGKHAQIVSCAVCWRGKRTIAYPWGGEAVEATRQILRAENPKIAHNAKFEIRMSRALLGTHVKNLVFDTMLAAHVLDNRPGTKSLKFQAFVVLGQPSYDDAVRPYFEARNANAPNRIKDLAVPALLEYNGLDSLLEYEIAETLSERLGIALG